MQAVRQEGGARFDVLSLSPLITLANEQHRWRETAVVTLPRLCATGNARNARAMSLEDA